jgi:hypothetical protein
MQKQHRWLIANANQYNIDIIILQLVVVQQGAIMATTLGITNTIDFTNEISKINDLH